MVVVVLLVLQYRSINKDDNNISALWNFHFFYWTHIVSIHTDHRLDFHISMLKKHELIWLLYFYRSHHYLSRPNFSYAWDLYTSYLQEIRNQSDDSLLHSSYQFADNIHTVDLESVAVLKLAMTAYRLAPYTVLVPVCMMSIRRGKAFWSLKHGIFLSLDAMMM